MGGNGFAITLPNPAARPMSLELSGRIRLTLRRGTQHLKREHDRKARRHPVLIQQKLDSHSAPSGDEIPASLSKKGHTAIMIELVEEVGQQHQIEPAAPISVERTPPNV